MTALCEAPRCEAPAEVHEDGMDLCRFHATHCECGRGLDDPKWWDCSLCRADSTAPTMNPAPPKDAE